MATEIRYQHFKNVGENTLNLTKSAIRKSLGSDLSPRIALIGGPHPGSFLNPVVIIPVIGSNEYFLRVRTSKNNPISSSQIREGLDIREPRIYLEPFNKFSQTIPQLLDGAFWRNYSAWEIAMSKKFTDGLPTTVSDVGYKPFWQTAGAEFVNITSSDNAGNINFAEIGAGAGRETKTILQVLQEELNLETFSRIRFGVVDRSPAAIVEAKTELDSFKRQTVFIESGASALSMHDNPFLREGLNVALIGNMFDNFPADQYVFLDGEYFSLESRAYIAAEKWQGLSGEFGVEFSPDHLLDSIVRISDEGLFRGRRLADRDVKLWKGFIDALCVEQRLTSASPNTSIDNTGTNLNDFQIPSSGFSLFNVSEIGGNVFKELIKTLKPDGVIAIFDIFRTSLEDFMSGNSDPTKFDGSVYQRVNLEQLIQIASKHDLSLRAQPFRKYNPASHGSIAWAGSEKAVSALDL